MGNQIKSTHVFYFPFSWEYKHSNSRQILKGYKNKKANMILNGWHAKSFQLLTDKTYNEYVYFYKPVLQVLYDIENKNNVSIYEKQGIDSNSFIQIQVEQKVYRLNMKNMELRLYRSGIGILSFECLNTRYDTPEAIMAINSLSKSVYPYKLPLSCAYQDLFPKEIKFYFNKEMEIIEKFKLDYKKEPMCIGELLRHIFGESFAFGQTSFKNDKVHITPLLGNRMFVLCMYQDPLFFRSIKNKHVSQRFLNNFILLSKKEKLLEGINYLDLPKVIYGISRFSVMCIMTSDKEVKLYNQLVLVALIQKASLLHFSNAIAFIADLPKQELVGAIENLYEIYVKFIGQMRFNEVTVDVQGSELYNRLLKQLNIERDVRELDFEMQEIHEYAMLIDQAQSKGKMDFLTIIGTALVIPTFVTGFFGMNILQEHFLDWWHHIEIMLWFNGYVLLPILIVLLIYSFWTRKSRKSMVTRNFLLIFLIISFYILMKWGCGIH